MISSSFQLPSFSFVLGPSYPFPIMSLNIDSQNQEHDHGGYDNSSSRQSISIEAHQNLFEQTPSIPPRTIHLRLSVFDNTRNLVTLHCLISNPQKDISEFEKAFDPNVSFDSLPITCDWFNVHAKAIALRGWPREAPGYKKWAERIA